MIGIEFEIVFLLYLFIDLFEKLFGMKILFPEHIPELLRFFMQAIDDEPRDVGILLKKGEI